jgi:hypothetical protein
MLHLPRENCVRVAYLLPIAPMASLAGVFEPVGFAQKEVVLARPLCCWLIRPLGYVSFEETRPNAAQGAMPTATSAGTWLSPRP